MSVGTVDASDVLSALEVLYGRVERRAHLGPVDELVATVLSQHTSDVNTARAFSSLKAAFPTWDAVVDAPVPPYAVPGDQLRIPLRLSNRSGRAIRARVTVRVEGELQVEPPAPGEITVEPGDAGERVVVLTDQGFASGADAVRAAQGEEAGDFVLYFNTTVNTGSLLVVSAPDTAASIARFTDATTLEDFQAIGFSANDFVFV